MDELYHQSCITLWKLGVTISNPPEARDHSLNSWESKGAMPHPQEIRFYSGTINNLLGPYFLGRWHWGGPLDSHNECFVELCQPFFGGRNEIPFRWMIQFLLDLMNPQCDTARMDGMELEF